MPAWTTPACSRLGAGRQAARVRSSSSGGLRRSSRRTAPRRFSCAPTGWQRSSKGADIEGIYEKSATYERENIMGGTLTTVSKGRLIRAIDQRLRVPKQEYLDELQSGQPLLSIGLDSGIVADAQQDHVRVEAFGGPDSPRAFWPKLQFKEQIGRAGYSQDLQIAVAPLRRNPPDPPKSIVSYWMVGGENFEIMVADSVQEVTVFWVTPRFSPPTPPAPP